MDEQGFRVYMQRHRKSVNATERCVSCVKDFARFLSTIEPPKDIKETSPEDLQEFAIWSKAEEKNTKTILWALIHYFNHLSMEELATFARRLREGEIKRLPLRLKDVHGVNNEDIAKLAKVGIGNVTELLDAAVSPHERTELSTRSGITKEAILELSKIADLCRIPGVKGIRARLYFDAGVDTLEKLAQWDPLELREMLLDYVVASNFDGIAPWLKEAKFTVETARKLPKKLEL